MEGEEEEEEADEEEKAEKQGCRRIVVKIGELKGRGFNRGYGLRKMTSLTSDLVRVE